MNKLLMYLMSFMLLFTISCDGSDPVSPDDSDDDVVLVGCEAANLYDWNSVEFEASLDAGATTWLAFDLSETTLFSINLNQAGFHCAIFESCDGELGSPPPVYSFQTNGNGQEVGIVTPGSYYLEILNTRPNRLDFEFSISLADIVYGCMDGNAINYNSDANVDDGSCELQDCNTEHYLAEWPDGMVLDCYGNCSPVVWLGDGFCDQGGWGIYDEVGNLIPVYLWCAELNWDNGDCDEIPEGCADDEVEDCNDTCAPVSWLGDGVCDDGSYQNNQGEDVFFNCEEFNNDEGDCDGQGRTTQGRTLPYGKVRVR